MKNIFIIVILTGVLSAMTPNSPSGSADTLAVIGAYVITTESFVKLYKEKLIKFGLTDKIDTREKYLQNLVDDEVMIAYARKIGLDRTKDARLEQKRIVNQQILNVYTDVHIVPAVTITENDLKAGRTMKTNRQVLRLMEIIRQSRLMFVDLPSYMCRYVIKFLLHVLTS